MEHLRWIVAFVLAFLWAVLAEWHEPRHWLAGVVMGLFGVFVWIFSRRFQVRRAARRGAVLLKPPRGRAFVRELLFGSVGALTMVVSVGILSGGLKAFFHDPSLEAARREVETLKLAGAWEQLADRAESYLEKWRTHQDKARAFAERALDAHIELGRLNISLGASEEHYSRARALAREWGLDERLADLGAGYTESQSKSFRLEVESRKLKQALEAKEAEAARIAQEKRELETSSKELRESLSRASTARDEALRAAEERAQERDSLLCAKTTLETEAGSAQGNLLKASTLLDERTKQLAVLAAEVGKLKRSGLERRSLPPGTSGEIHHVELKELLPAVTLSLRTRQGEPVPGLRAKDFGVTLDGAPKDVVAALDLSLRDTQQSTDIVLAFDVSKSVEGKPLGDAKEAAREFLSALGGGERIAIVAFSDTPLLRQRWTDDRALAARTVESLSAAGRTALNDAVWFCLDELEPRQSESRYLILFTDGRDTGSRQQLRATIERSKRVGVPIYTVGLQSKELDTAPLEAFSRETGGRSLTAASSRELSDLYRQVASEIKSRYRLIVAIGQDHGTLEVTAGGENEVTMRSTLKPNAQPVDRAPKTLGAK